MKTNLDTLIRQGRLITPCLFLFGAILCATPCLAQSTKKQDSICICGSPKEIDSTLKILNDYPELLKSKELVSQILADERSVSKSEKEAILRLLNINEWDVRKVKRKIRWLNIRGTVWAIGGLAVGLALVIFK